MNVTAVTPILNVSDVPASLRWFEALGFRDVGTIPNAVRVIRPRQFLTRLDPAEGAPPVRLTCPGFQ